MVVSTPNSLSQPMPASEATMTTTMAHNRSSTYTSRSATFVISVARSFFQLVAIMALLLMLCFTSSAPSSSSSLLLSCDGFALVGPPTTTLRTPTQKISKCSSCRNRIRSLLSMVEDGRSINDSNDNSAPMTVEEATTILAQWDKYYNAKLEARKKPLTPPTTDLFVDMTKTEATSTTTEGQGVQQETVTIESSDVDDDKSQQDLIVDDKLPTAVRVLSQAAADERRRDSTQGRCMLGICAPSAQDGLTTLKSWVSTLDLPRGLLHGMDKDGVPLQIDGGVYIKYNSGGVYTFEDIRKSGLGFEALWKPGDAMLEPYDGYVEGVYVQVELSDEEFRQFLVPLDIFNVQ